MTALVTRHVFGIAVIMTAMTGGSLADTLIREHGRYSATYSSDWSGLPTGKELARQDIDLTGLPVVDGATVRQSFRDREQVSVSGKRLRIRWANATCDKYRQALFYFVNCERVVIEDLVIVQDDPDYRASSTLFFEGCGSIEIRNCYLAGTCGKSFIRIEGCSSYFIDRLEITGLAYAGTGLLSGPGIFINNGAGWDTERQRPKALYATDVRELEWGVIQNSYIHDYPTVVKGTNHDGILWHAPAAGLLFNCVFENYEADSCLDISHRRNDAGYQNHHFRIERNVFRNCHRVKTNGAVGSESCDILWVNNVYVDSMLTDYHTGWRNRHEHETFVYTRNCGYFCTMYCRSGGTSFRNCLLYSPVRLPSMYEPWGLTGEDFSALQPSSFLYLMPVPGTWLKPRRNAPGTISDWATWQGQGFDTSSRLLPDTDPQFVDAAKGDYRLRANSPALAAGVDATRHSVRGRPGVVWDFWKRPRPSTPSAGALEQ